MLRRSANVALAHKFERTWFIGAGFTAGMGYPVGQALIGRLLDYLANGSVRLGASNDQPASARLNRSWRAQADAMHNLMSSVLETYCAARGDEQKSVDVTEFFTIAQMLAEYPSFFSEQDGMGRVATPHLFNQVAAAVRTFFYDLSMANQPKDMADVLKHVRSDRDAVVNFNWDEEVDVALGERRIGRKLADVAYTHGSWRPDSHFLLLRPHGSIGWYDVSVGLGNREAYFISEWDPRIPRFEKRIVSYRANELPCDSMKRDSEFALTCPPIITAPTFAKRFAYREQTLIWKDVLRVCSESREFVFLGYSLPQDDYLTRAAIRRALIDSHKSRRRRRIRCLVIDRAPSTQLVERFQQVFGEQVSRDRHFLQWTFGKSGRRGESLRDIIDRKLEAAVV